MSLINNDITKFDDLCKQNINFVLTLLSMNTLKGKIEAEEAKNLNK